MKKQWILVLVVAASAWSSAAVATECFTNRRVVAVNIGYVDVGLPGTPDGGDAVLFKLDNGQVFPLNASYNLDWARGQALHRTLVAAMAARWRVTGHDHHGTRCDDIDELRIMY